jgi:hypothetical protein
MWRCKRTGGQFPPRRLQRVTACRRGIWNWYSKHWCAKAFSRAYAARAAATSWRANDILRAAGTVDEETAEPTSVIVTKVVLPLLTVAEQAFAKALSQINLDDLARYAESGNGTGRDEAA